MGSCLSSPDALRSQRRVPPPPLKSSGYYATHDPHYSSAPLPAYNYPVRSQSRSRPRSQPIIYALPPAYNSYRSSGGRGMSMPATRDPALAPAYGYGHSTLLVPIIAP